MWCVSVSFRHFVMNFIFECNLLINFHLHFIVVYHELRTIELWNYYENFIKLNSYCMAEGSFNLKFKSHSFDIPRSLFPWLNWHNSKYKQTDDHESKLKQILLILVGENKKLPHKISYICMRLIWTILFFEPSFTFHVLCDLFSYCLFDNTATFLPCCCILRVLLKFLRWIFAHSMWCARVALAIHLNTLW